MEEGRSIYKNTKQFVRYLIPTNINKAISVFLTAFLGLSEALTPAQMFWDGLMAGNPPVTTLDFNMADADIMHCPPHRGNDPLIRKSLFV
jgi:Ca2+ transporting ATPase